MKAVIVGLSAVGLMFGIAASTPAAEQSKAGKSDSQGQMRSTDPAAPSDRDSHLGPQDTNKQGGRSGEASQRMSRDADRGTGQDPVEQQQTGTGSGKSSGGGAGQ